MRLIVVAVLLGVVATSAEARPRFYMQIQGVKEPAGTKPSVQDQARTYFQQELGKHPEVVTTLKDPAPVGKELERELKARKLQGYGVVLRVTRVSHSLNPPAKGKVYHVLMVDVAVAIDAEKIPSGQLALAGEGNAQVGTEVSRLNEKERIQLTHEALLEAVHQAVGKSVTRLASPEKASKPPRRRARRKR